MIEGHTIARAGSNIHYWTAGPETGHLVTLVHGATLDHHGFDMQIPALVEAGFRVLTFDIRGHGESKPIGPQISVAVIADDLAAILDQLGVDRTDLIGHSFGGYVVQEFTHRYPDRVRRLGVIGCTNLAAKASPAYRLLYNIFPKILSRMSLDSFRQRTLANLSVSQDVKACGAQAMQDIPKEDFVTIIIAGIACLWLENGFEANYRIPKPFLLTHGALDNANGKVFHRTAAAWAAQEPDCRYEVIPNAGHTAHMDNPTAFNAVMLDFLHSKS